MKHRIKGRRLSRSTQHRRALAKNLITALFLHGRIVTTGPKAKEYRPIAEKLITLGRTKSLAHVRQAVAVLGDKAAVARLFDEIGPSFATRPGGYTRIVKLPTPRLGDKGSRVIFEVVNHVPKARPVAEGDDKEKAGKAARAKGKAAAGAAAGKTGRKAGGKDAEPDAA
jgi:large subunit ribosomal protein L17